MISWTSLQSSAAALPTWTKRAALAAACVTALMLPSAVVSAQNYPNKPIRLIVPWPPGGGVDTSARLISQPLQERLGQPIVVENKPGASGNIGTAIAVQEKPDGYTLLQGSLSPNAVNPHLFKRLGFDPEKDFTFIASVYTVPSFLVVPASSPFKTAQELVAYAKANPGKLNFGSGGVGSSQHLFAVMFKAATNIDVVHVAYKGTSPSETALVAGQVDFMLDPPTCLPFVQAGKLRILGVASNVRNSALPDVPTLDEQGIKGVYTSTFYGIMGPPGMPKDVTDRLNKEINAILQTSDMKSRLAKLAADPGKGTPEEFKAYVMSEMKRYGEIVKLSGADKVD
ncbi:tripartite tricarboxylate transporter substrate binding protein [Xanthobacteraceae bacterium Astr-EGSB]|uniref:Bug family tripartite tricarboxylate transporter substrate binding protein n=1 Tax=Astrobacterium formosum TaxID=3069710 RepID=UPI0027B31103|nr:tripartite tricarboxylate transporter substrate binding protein [Xanthobacteraceae bacterium Astr-EGSB]